MQINKVNISKQNFGMPFREPEVLIKNLTHYRDNVHPEIGRVCLEITDWLKDNSGKQFVSCTETTKGLLKKSPALRFEVHSGLPNSSNYYSTTVKNRGTLGDLKKIGRAIINVHDEVVRRRYEEVPNFLRAMNTLKKMSR